MKLRIELSCIASSEVEFLTIDSRCCTVQAKSIYFLKAVVYLFINGLNPIVLIEVTYQNEKTQLTFKTSSKKNHTNAAKCATLFSLFFIFIMEEKKKFLS